MGDQAGPPTTEKQTQEPNKKKRRGDIETRCLRKPWCLPEAPRTTRLGHPQQKNKHRSQTTKKPKGGYRDEVSSQTLVPTRSPKDDQAGPPTTERQTQEPNNNKKNEGEI